MASTAPAPAPVPAPAEPVGTPPVLRRLYVVRFVFAVAWAALLLLGGSELTLGVQLLLALYPAFDVAAAVVDARSARAAGPLKALYANMAVSALAVVGVAVASTSGVADVLRVWAHGRSSPAWSSSWWAWRAGRWAASGP